MTNSIERGEIYYADLSPIVGSEQGGTRPVVIIQNNVGNKFSPTVIVAAITSKLSKAKLPTHIFLESDVLPLNSMAMLEQIRTIDKSRLTRRIGKLPHGTMNEIGKKILISFGLAS